MSVEIYKVHTSTQVNFSKYIHKYMYTKFPLINKNEMCNNFYIILLIYKYEYTFKRLSFNILVFIIPIGNSFCPNLTQISCYYCLMHLYWIVGY